MTRNILFPLVLLSVALSATAQAQPRGVPLDGIIAIVNEDVILRSDLDRRTTAIRENILRSGNPVPPETVLQRQVLERLVIERVQLQRASETGITMSEDMLNQTINNIARNNNLTLDQFIEALAADGINYSDFRQEIHDDMLMQQVRQRDVFSRINISQREIDTFLASTEAQSLDSREFQVSHIMLRLDSDAPAAEIERVRALAENLVVRAREDEDFAQLAVAHSQGQQALEGGDLGWRRSTQLPSLFAERVVSMRAGQVADVIRTSGALHIIKLNDVRGEQERVIMSQTKASHIVIMRGPLMNEARAMERLNDIHRQLTEGADFADLARRHSEDIGSATMGGDLGWVTPGDVAGPFEDMMNTLSPGEFSVPVATQFGWHIVRVDERREHDSTEELRVARAAQILRERRAEEATDVWLRRLYDEAYIENRLEG